MNKIYLYILAIIMTSFVITACENPERQKAAGEQIKGTTQKAVGEATDNPKTKAEGNWNRTKGHLRDTKEDIKDTIKGD